MDDKRNLLLELQKQSRSDTVTSICARLEHAMLKPEITVWYI